MSNHETPVLRREGIVLRLHHGSDRPPENLGIMVVEISRHQQQLRVQLADLLHKDSAQMQGEFDSLSRYAEGGGSYLLNAKGEEMHIVSLPHHCIVEAGEQLQDCGKIEHTIGVMLRRSHNDEFDPQNLGYYFGMGVPEPRKRFTMVDVFDEKKGIELHPQVIDQFPQGARIRTQRSSYYILKLPSGYRLVQQDQPQKLP